MIILINIISYLERHFMKQQIFIVGDSTAAIKADDKRPETGWGEKFPQFISAQYQVNDFAFNGASTKTFLKRGVLKDINQKIKPNDYLLIQFGHNDQKIEDPDWGTSISEYQKNLTKFINFAKHHGAISIVLSSIIRRNYQDGQLVNTLGDYPKAAKECANANDTFFIDMNQVTFDYVKLQTPEESKKLWLNVDHSANYPNGVHDNTHLNNYGATIIAKLTALELAKLQTPLAKAITLK